MSAVEDIQQVAERVRAEGKSKPRAGRHPVNQPMVDHWLDAMGDKNPIYVDEAAAKAAAQAAAKKAAEKKARKEAADKAAAARAAQARAARAAEAKALLEALPEGPVRHALEGFADLVATRVS